jgi:hypothetical protein
MLTACQNPVGGATAMTCSLRTGREEKEKKEEEEEVAHLSPWSTSRANSSGVTSCAHCSGVNSGHAMSHGWASSRTQSLGMTVVDVAPGHRPTCGPHSTGDRVMLVGLAWLNSKSCHMHWRN